MTKFDALYEIIEYISIYWPENQKPLTPVWMWMLMEIAKEAHGNDWDRDRIRQEMEDRL